MNISLPKEFSDFVKERVKRGEYRSSSAVVRAGLLLLQQAILEHDRRDVKHDARMRQFKGKFLETLPDIRIEDVHRATMARKPKKPRARQRLHGA